MTRTRTTAPPAPILTRCCFDLYWQEDLPGNNDLQRFQKAYNAGWIGFIHKLSQGASFRDPKAAFRLSQASMVTGVYGRMLLGGYHFMTPTDRVAAQVGNFMRAHTATAESLMLVLDFEPKKGSAQAEEMASEFVDAIRAITGQLPVLYTGRWDVAAIPMDNLPSCDLWLAEYGTNPIPPWKDDAFKLHQYSDGKVGPNPVNIPGIGYVDQSEYAGTLSECTDWWRGKLVGV